MMTRTKKKAAPLFSTAVEFHNGKKIAGIVVKDESDGFKVALTVNGKQTSYGVWPDYGNACSNAQAWVDKYLSSDGRLK